MSNYRLYGTRIIEDDTTMKAFAESLVRNMELHCVGDSDLEEFRDSALDLIGDSIRDDISRTDIDYEKLMYQWRSEIGYLLYDMENNGHVIRNHIISFFGEEAQKSLEFLLLRYIGIHFQKLIGIKQDKESTVNSVGKKDGWILTDDDACQFRRKVRDGVFELYQIQAKRAFDAETNDERFGIAHAVIFVREIDIENVLDSYGYDSADELKEAYGDEWEEILAECDFELTAGCGEAFIESPCMSWNEARELIFDLINQRL